MFFYVNDIETRTLSKEQNQNQYQYSYPDMSRTLSMHHNLPVARNRLTPNKIIMVALCNRADHYIFMLWFAVLLLLLSFFSLPNLSRRRLDVCHTSTHGVALVRI